MKSGFKKLSKTELIRLRGGKAVGGCCTHTSANSGCTDDAYTCTANSAAVSLINGNAYDAKGKFLKSETKSLRNSPKNTKVPCP